MPSSPAVHPRYGFLVSSRFTLLSLLFLFLLLFVYLSHHPPYVRHPDSGDKPAPVSPLSPPPPPPPPPRGDKAEHFRRLFLDQESHGGPAAANSSISEHLKVLTLGPHLAGTPSSASAAAYVFQLFHESGLKARELEYRVLLSYPIRSCLSIVPADGEARLLDLSEPISTALPPGSGSVVPPYHGYSPSGAALAPPVYANYGRREDYQMLAAMGVDVRGCVVVVRGGGGYRGAVVQRAAERGAAAVVFFSAGDGAEDSRGGVERGTVLLGGPGDPLTPGWAAVNAEDVQRLLPDDGEVLRRFPAIPSLPVPATAAGAILRAMAGPPPPDEWQRGLGPETPVIGVGGGGPGLLLNFSYEGAREMKTIKNVVGEVAGSEEPDRYVILGNHRDAWTFGAVDPNSGTAALLEIARRLAVLLRRGWRPRRTIILCSWDAEEFGMIGSTEWVEEHLALLQAKAVAYLNVDCAVQGPGFFASATPQLDGLLAAVTKKVKDPDAEGRTVYETWTAAGGRAPMERLGRADSDFTGFLHLAGVPSLDMFFGRDYPVYHTSFDSYAWMKKHGDPSFHRHVAMSEIWGLAALHLADDPIIPFDYLSYATQLQEHSSAMSSWLPDVAAASMQPLSASIRELIASASAAREEEQRLREEARADAASELRRRAFNDRLMLAERGFLAPEGLNGRPWFKHLIYSPAEDESSERGLPPFFPGIADAIAGVRADPAEEEDGGDEARKAVQREVWRVSRAVSRAAASLRELV